MYIWPVLIKSRRSHLVNHGRMTVVAFNKEFQGATEMDCSSSSYKTFWRKRLPKRFRHIYGALAIVAALMLFVIPTSLAWSFLNDFAQESELAEILEADNNNMNVVQTVRRDLKECDQLEAKLRDTDPKSAEYKSIKSSCDCLKQEVAGTMPCIVEGYDEYGVPVVMSYKEFVEKTTPD